MKKFLPLAVVCLLAACCAQLGLGQVAATRPAAALFAAESYLQHVKYLASDELSGRLPGSEGIEMAAEYIARQFAQAGLEPGGEEGTWFQEFEVQRGKKIDPDSALLEVEGIDRKWKARQDWTPLPFTAMEDVEGPLAFAGYGIKARLHEYNDYEDFDAEGKILLIFRYEPVGDDPEADFGGKEVSHYSQFRNKVKTAARAGAKALIIVNPPLREGATDELYEFSEELAKQTFDLPLVHVTRAVGEALVKKAGLDDLATLQAKLDQERRPLSRDLGFNVKLHPGVMSNMIKTRNVLGLLRGSGDSDEVIALGAHYDHLGRVSKQFQFTDETPVIHNGADDNASGTAAVIELARVLASEPKLRRNVLCIAFSAEEMGLLGSKHFVEAPTVALDKIAVLVNFDMVGRLSLDKFAIYGTPSGRELPDLVSQAAERAGIEYRAAKGLTGNSDHASFYEHQIPYLFPFTGVHKQYHQPEDDWELIDAEGAARILGMFHEIVRELANMPAGPAFQDQLAEPEPEDLEMKPAAEHDKDAPDAEARPAGKASPDAAGGEVERATRPRVRFGIIPDFTQSEMVVDTVLDDGPAKAAGMKDGDKILRVGDDKIKDIYAYMAVLKQYKPGDTLKVVVERDGKERTLDVTLTESGQPRKAD